HERRVTPAPGLGRDRVVEARMEVRRMAGGVTDDRRQAPLAAKEELEPLFVLAFALRVFDEQALDGSVDEEHLHVGFRDDGAYERPSAIPIQVLRVRACVPARSAEIVVTQVYVSPRLVRQMRLQIAAIFSADMSNPQ